MIFISCQRVSGIFEYVLILANNHRMLLRSKPNLRGFFQLLYLESWFFLSVAYLTVANLARLGISVHCQVSGRSQYLVRLLSQCWITGGHTIHPPIERLLPPTGIEPTPFQNSASKVAGLQVHTTTPDLIYHVSFCIVNSIFIFYIYLFGDFPITSIYYFFLFCKANLESQKLFANFPIFVQLDACDVIRTLDVGIQDAFGSF